ncbi:MAG: LamG domain-containing protein [Candidatus Marsarchaeota archaeon]|nr:LamG domain-containing protein [Candidatus Marsarchaeota archaeon]
MKGFIFTVDAIFSLIVATAAVSILLYMQFSAPQSFQAPSTLAQGLLQSMLRTTFGQVAQGGSITEVQAGYSPAVPFGYANFLQAPAGYIKAVTTPQYTNNITVSFWVYPTNNSLWGASGNYWENALSGSKGCGDSYYFYLEAGASPPTELWGIKNTGGSNFQNSPGAHLIPNQWQQLIGAYNGTYLIVYLNGKRIGSPMAATGSILYNGTTISGTNPTSSSGCNPISGGIADVQVYGYALGANAANALYAEGIDGSPLNSYDLLGWWPLDGNANDYAGTVNGQTTYTTFVQTGTTQLWGYNFTSNESMLHALSELYLNNQSAVADMLFKNLYNTSDSAIFINNEYAPAMDIAQFNGASSYVQVNNTPDLSVGTQLTFYAWLNPSSLSGCGSQGCIIFNKENSYEWALSSTGQLCWALNTTSPRWTWICPSLYVPADKWSQVALTYNGSAVIAYLNTAKATPYPATGGVGNTGLALRIGARGAPGTANSLFTGEIADVQIYNSSLSATQISQLYQQGIAAIPVSNAKLIGWWPLDGNANDYSGNGNEGTSISVQYTQQGPMPPGLQNAYSVSKASAPMLLNAGGTSKLYNVSVVVWH